VHQAALKTNLRAIGCSRRYRTASKARAQGRPWTRWPLARLSVEQDWIASLLAGSSGHSSRHRTRRPAVARCVSVRCGTGEETGRGLPSKLHPRRLRASPQPPRHRPPGPSTQLKSGFRCIRHQRPAGRPSGLSANAPEANDPRTRGGGSLRGAIPAGCEGRRSGWRRCRSPDEDEGLGGCRLLAAWSGAESGSAAWPRIRWSRLEQAGQAEPAGERTNRRPAARCLGL